MECTKLCHCLLTLTAKHRQRVTVILQSFGVFCPSVCVSVHRKQWVLMGTVNSQTHVHEPMHIVRMCYAGARPCLLTKYIVDRSTIGSLLRIYNCCNFEEGNIMKTELKKKFKEAVLPMAEVFP